MGIKGFNQSGDTFRNKFARAASGDSTGLDSVPPPPGPAQAMGATGGTTIEYETTPGSIYKSHTFTATSSPGFTISSLGTGDSVPGNTVDVMVVGGGGGGGENIGGGGGAGGMRVFTEVPVTTGGYPVTIGAGGATGSSPTPGYTNQSTTFALTPYGPIVGSGGGGGGGYAGLAGAYWRIWWWPAVTVAVVQVQQ